MQITEPINNHPIILRNLLRKYAAVTGVIVLMCLFQSCSTNEKQQNHRPNILIAISDDQSFLSNSFSGSPEMQTPAFDRVAREGIFFTNCIAGSPGCAPSRSSLVTGRYPWQNEQSGQHASSWMKKYVPFVDLLENNGYQVGFTGKGVAPFKYADNDSNRIWRRENAAGHEYNRIRYDRDNDERTTTGEHPINYFENFRDFLGKKGDGQPFCFWYGSFEPHLPYEVGSWKRTDKDPGKADVPKFLPAADVVRGDLLDYKVEIEWFDLHLERMLAYLEEIGELDNTIVIVTADNGMPFPRSKANSYEYGIHVPLAIRYPKAFGHNLKVDDLISFVDFAPTLLDLTGTGSEGMLPITGRSFKNILTSKKQG
ncbi:MAG: sulfatase, partial [Draconibacterium sp.]